MLSVPPALVPICHFSFHFVFSCKDMTWCKRAFLSREGNEQPDGSVIGLSYGIEQRDLWSELVTCLWSRLIQGLGSEGNMLQRLFLGVCFYFLSMFWWLCTSGREYPYYSIQVSSIHCLTFLFIDQTWICDHNFYQEGSLWRGISSDCCWQNECPKPADCEFDIFVTWDLMTAVSSKMIFRRNQLMYPDMPSMVWPLA